MRGLLNACILAVVGGVVIIQSIAGIPKIIKRVGLSCIAEYVQLASHEFSRNACVLSLP